MNLSDVRCQRHANESAQPDCIACRTLTAEYTPYVRFSDQELGIER